MNDMFALVLQPAIRPYRMTAEGYVRTILAGGFDGDNVELVDGELIQMAPAGFDHGVCTASLLVEISTLYRPLGYPVVTDVMVVLNDETVRAPDISIVDAAIPTTPHLAPADILLAIEISNSTLTEDLGRKRIDYSAAGIRNYWVVDLSGRRVHTFTDPQGADYGALRIVPFGEPIAVPGVEGAVTVS